MGRAIEIIDHFQNETKSFSKQNALEIKLLMRYLDTMSQSLPILPMSATWCFGLLKVEKLMWL